MNVSKLLISSAAAVAVVGAIGLANAQSTDASTTNQPSNQQLDRTGVPTQTPATDTSMGNTTPAPSVDSSTANTAEPVAQVDRN